MDCERVGREEILDSYLLGRLNEADAHAFEAHCFECVRCFEDLEALTAIQRELRRSGGDSASDARVPVLRWAPAAGLAAAAVLAAGVMFWMRAPATTPEPPGAQVSSARETPVRTPAPTGQAGVPDPSLAQLARVEPPPYEPVTLRGAADEATARFRRGMDHYRKGDYDRAIVDLRDASQLDPGAAHVRFFLGICHLMSGQDGAAVEQLRATLALGDSAYLEEAHWYLAKAYLRRKDVGAARAQLTALVALRGARRAEAQRLLSDIETLEK
ncbi:MAG TPA: tetratricopeptide repeat protein [Vicinamibacterales bacterium]|nr:tetratricopeptide repeat protein [Vicinamibacterales bacterium]